MPELSGALQLRCTSRRADLEAATGGPITESVSSVLCPMPPENKDVTDIYGNPFHATLAEVVEHLSHAPYWHVDEKAPARLVRAAQLIRQSRVQLHDAHRATVYGHDTRL